MKVMTVLGTRPEIIRLSLVIPKLDGLCDHVVVHTGQNYDRNLNDVFFQELELRSPQINLGIVESAPGRQIGRIIAEVERVLDEERPDRVLILGDTNSALAAIIAKRQGIPVFHMEAGNRCYDDRVPEEVNRRIVDHSSDVLMPYTERSRSNLLREGIDARRVFVTGNPIHEVLTFYAPRIAASGVLERLSLDKGRYVLVTLHRAENVDDPLRLQQLVDAIDRVQRELDVPVVCSLHPRTAHTMSRAGIQLANAGVTLHEPFGLFDFVALETSALCVLSDSGTVQEECCLLRVANVTIRDVTERPETIESGSNMLSGASPDDVLRCVRTVLSQNATWRIPPEYLAENVSDTVVRLVLGYQHWVS